MGSSHSQLQRNPSSPSAAQSPSSPPPTNTRHFRFNSLRRFSNLGRRNNDASTNSKRLRQGSTTSDSLSPRTGSESGGREEGKKKKARASSPVAPNPIPEEISIASPKSTLPPAPESSDQVMEDNVEATSSSSMQTSAHAPTLAEPIQTASIISRSSPVCSAVEAPPIQQSILLTPTAAPIPLPTTPSSEISDPLSEERRQSLTLIRDTLGPEWQANSTSPSSSSAGRIFDHFRRTSSSPDLNDQSGSEGRSIPQRTMSDRLTALLGFSTPGISSEAPQREIPTREPTSSIDDADRRLEESESAIQELTERLTQAREELAQTERQLNDAQDRVERRRVTPGAVLIIQGLAQTHAQPSFEDESVEAGNAEGNEPRRRPGMRARRSSEGSTSHPRRGFRNQSRDSDNRSNIETQARMIGGLLTVTAAATATTLLAPSSPPFPPANPRSPAASALEAIVNRIRPRQNRTQTVEAALGNYLRTAIQGSNDRPFSTNPTVSPAPEGEGGSTANADVIASEFQRFLEGVQGDLVGAVREFAGPLPVNLTTSASPALDAQPEMRDVAEEDSFVTAPSTAPTPIPPSPSDDHEGATSNILPVDPIVPTFHSQLGQNLPRDSTAPTPQVTGGTDGQPRRLNFFRAHMFPPLPSTSSPLEDNATANQPIVPCIFIGVRSVRHDPNMTTDELAEHPNFPFVDGQAATMSPVSAAATTPLASPSDLSTTATDDGSAGILDSGSTHTSPSLQSSALPDMSTSNISSGVSTERRSLRERVLDRLNPSRTRRHDNTIGEGPLQTYLVYVIGGNYPQNHPILSIPSLITGGPLTDEEMNLISELMGPAKPPTVDNEEIQKSGLKVVKGDQMAQLTEKGELLDICADRCLICLSDYEPEEECRILNCKHGYHKECVDQWLIKGRNSCPACRSEAVDKTKSPTISTSADHATEELPIVNQDTSLPMDIDQVDSAAETNNVN
uniref:RING-type domain-containing protein n=1 Tax=Kwoniella pini CBS 10737 TaxID=1296096 RepID=A0A1B9I4W3_9TREE|nr:uncharacterized protein I206_03871 [Kwoniella pini CBS 10737]OCF50546.1 hypothetical protein I206_03871 [Kwoniella pini CBS 10737]